MKSLLLVLSVLSLSAFADCQSVYENIANSNNGHALVQSGSEPAPIGFRIAALGNKQKQDAAKILDLYNQAYDLQGKRLKRVAKKSKADIEATAVAIIETMEDTEFTCPGNGSLPAKSFDAFVTHVLYLENSVIL